jgi:hypothetical protein
MDRAVLATYADSLYLRKLLALYNSAIKNIPNVHVYILALDKKVSDATNGLPNTTVVQSDSWLTRELVDARQGRTHAEKIFTLTPSWVRWVLHREDAVAYVDADCYFFSNPSKLYQEVIGTEVAITPHRFYSDIEAWEQRSGKYNVGFVYFEQSQKAFECLNDWDDEVKHKNSLALDQLCWNRLVPTYDVHPIEDIATGAAPWNAKQYTFKSKDGQILVNDEPLIMYHAHQCMHDDAGNLTFRTHWELPESIDCVYEEYEKGLKDVVVK